MISGLSETSAKRKVALELADRVAQASVSGALMSFGFTSAGVTKKSVLNTINKSIDAAINRLQQDINSPQSSNKKIEVTPYITEQDGIRTISADKNFEENAFVDGLWDGSPNRKNLKMKPEVINDIDTTLKKQLAFVDNTGQLTFIPTSVIITNTKVIAGTDVKSIFRDAKKYVNKYGGKESDYRKVVGKIESEKYIFDIHFVKDVFGNEYDFKIKSKTLR